MIRLKSLPSASRTNRAAQGTNGHWRFDKPMRQGKVLGFIYLVHDLVADKMYIGRKQYASRGSATKGQESNWKWYTTSCDELEECIKINGKDEFIFYVLDEYKTKGGLGFAETWSMMNVELPYYKDYWYNTLVPKVAWSTSEPISLKHKQRLALIISGQGLELPTWLS